MDEISALQSLRVSYNDVGSVEMTHFIGQLHTLKHLKGVQIRPHSWGKSGADSINAAALIGAISENTSLEFCDVEFVSTTFCCPEPGVDEELLGRNLRSLCLSTFGLNFSREHGS